MDSGSRRRIEFYFRFVRRVGGVKKWQCSLLRADPRTSLKLDILLKWGAAVLRPYIYEAWLDVSGEPVAYLDCFLIAAEVGRQDVFQERGLYGFADAVGLGLPI
jgi:hypothetical protein